MEGGGLGTEWSLRQKWKATMCLRTQLWCRPKFSLGLRWWLGHPLSLRSMEGVGRKGGVFWEHSPLATLRRRVGGVLTASRTQDNQTGLCPLVPPSKLMLFRPLSRPSFGVPYPPIWSLALRLSLSPGSWMPSSMMLLSSTTWQARTRAASWSPLGLARSLPPLATASPCRRTPTGSGP